MGDGGDGRGDLAGVKVMVVEDEAIVAFDLEYTLLDHGCIVLGPVATIADALAMLSADRPDVALLDVGLADGPSTEVARRLAALGVPYVVASGYEDDHLDDPVLRSTLRLTKPYQPAALSAALMRALGRRDGDGPADGTAA